MVTARNRKAPAIRRAIRAKVPGWAFTPHTLLTTQVSGRSWPGSDTCRERQRTAADKPAREEFGGLPDLFTAQECENGPGNSGYGSVWGQPFPVSCDQNALARHHGPYSLLAASHLCLAADEYSRLDREQQKHPAEEICSAD